MELRLRRILAENTRKKREEEGFTLEEIADRADMHWRQWQRVEAGKVNATLKTVSRIMQALKVEAWELFRSE
jgi:predicted transcriptional regulator